MRHFVLAAAILMSACASAPAAPGGPAPSVADILAQASAEEWRTLDPENLLVMDLPRGQVIIELAPEFAPQHAVNLRALARESYFDGAAVVRAQDNFVAQWSRTEESPREIRTGRATLPPEFTRPRPGVAFTALPDGDVYAREAGFAGGFPAARDGREIWLAHCYGMVGAGRDVASDSGSGTELYAVTGHAPRQLDRNITLVGRVVQGIELLSALPRGTGALGFYETPAERTAIARVRVGADMEAPPRLQALRTDSARFARLTEARRNRRDEWYKVPAGAIELCNVPLPVRPAP